MVSHSVGGTDGTGERSSSVNESLPNKLKSPNIQPLPPQEYSLVNTSQGITGFGFFK